MKIKLVDLTLRQIMNICDKHNKKCSKCPLYHSYFDCFALNTKFEVWGDTYDRKRLLNDEIEIKEGGKQI